MNNLNAGYARLVITPPMGIGISGYFQERYAEKVLDDLYVCALALSVGDKKAVIVSLDLLDIKGEAMDIIREYASRAAGIDTDAVFISCSHTHTGPYCAPDSKDELVREYFKTVTYKVADAVKFAITDLRSAKMAFGVGCAPRISFSRRFRMKDGSVRTNPGVMNPDILEAIGEVDERVNVLRFDREGADNIVLVNFGTHPDTIGGCDISADWPGFVRTTLEAALGDAKCIFLNGAQGDVNHINVFPRPGEANGLHKDFDDVDRGYAHAKHMGNVVAGAVLQIYEKLAYTEVESLSYAVKNVLIPANVPTPEELPLAIKYNELHLAGRDEEIPFKGMALTTAVADAARKIKLQNGPENFEMPLSAIVIGKVALIGIAGEPFSAIGIGLKANNPEFDLVLPCALTNGGRGYFPTKDAYAEGGYETATSNFKAGVAEKLIEEGTKLLSSLK